MSNFKLFSDGLIRDESFNYGPIELIDKLSAEIRMLRDANEWLVSQLETVWRIEDYHSVKDTILTNKITNTNNKTKKQYA